jgi:hypothetical protein
MRLFLVFILIVSNFSLSAQNVTDTIINDIIHALNAKQVSTLIRYIEAEKHSNFIRCETLREVVGTNREGVFKVEMVRKPDSVGNVDNFTINLLADKDNIFFYELRKWIFKRKDNGTYYSYPVTVDTYKELGAYQQFEKLFAKTYRSSLDTNDLFQTSIVYGSSCGIAATPTEYQQKLITILQKRDLATLSTWLRSPNIEKQLYAIKGLYKLQGSGDYQITSEEKKIIDAIANKNGEAQTCSGCIYSSESISNLVNKMDTTAHFSFLNFKNEYYSIYFGLILAAVAVLFFYFWKRHRATKL